MNNNNFEGEFENINYSSHTLNNCNKYRYALFYNNYIYFNYSKIKLINCISFIIQYSLIYMILPLDWVTLIVVTIFFFFFLASFFTLFFCFCIADMEAKVLHTARNKPCFFCLGTGITFAITHLFKINRERKKSSIMYCLASTFLVAQTLYMKKSFF